MDTALQEISEMQKFLGISERPITVYRKEDSRYTPDYDTWLSFYRSELRKKCEEKLVKEFYDNLAKDLFKKKFSSFQEFQHH